MLVWSATTTYRRDLSAAAPAEDGRRRRPPAGPALNSYGKFSRLRRRVGPTLEASTLDTAKTVFDAGYQQVTPMSSGASVHWWPPRPDRPWPGRCRDQCPGCRRPPSLTAELLCLLGGR